MVEELRGVKVTSFFLAGLHGTWLDCTRLTCLGSAGFMIRFTSVLL